LLGWGCGAGELDQSWWFAEYRDRAVALEPNRVLDCQGTTRVSEFSSNLKTFSFAAGLSRWKRYMLIVSTNS
jgi:hypothetical protein